MYSFLLPITLVLVKFVYYLRCWYQNVSCLCPCVVELDMWVTFWRCSCHILVALFTVYLCCLVHVKLTGPSFQTSGFLACLILVCTLQFKSRKALQNNANVFQSTVIQSIQSRDTENTFFTGIFWAFKHVISKRCTVENKTPRYLYMYNLWLNCRTLTLLY